MKIFSLESKIILSVMFVVLGFFALNSSVLAATSSLPSNNLLMNPLPVAQELYCPTAACDLKEMFLLILQGMLRLIPVASVLFIIVGAFQMIASHGNEEALARAKRTIVWSILGLVFALLSFSIVAIVQNLLHVNLGG